MEKLIALIRSHEEWLMARILVYAKERDYTRYTSTLQEAWRLSIAGLSASLIEGLARFRDVPELGPDDDFRSDPLTKFGIVEAQRHRARGVTLAMFLGLMKYYRQSYLDLLTEKCAGAPELPRYVRCLDRSFDRIEIAFCVEWTGTSEEARLQELQHTNRRLANEKNAYLTVFESLYDPVVLVDANGLIVNLNHAAAMLIDRALVPGAQYYRDISGAARRDREAPAPAQLLAGKPLLALFPWLREPLERLAGEKDGIAVRECTAAIHHETRHFEIRQSRMLDVSGKFAAAILVLRDISLQKRAEQERARLNEELLEKNRELEQIIYAVSHDLRAPLINVQGFSAALERAVKAVRTNLETSLPPGPPRDSIAAIFDRDFREALDHMRSSVRTMGTLIDGLLRFCRLGRISVHPERLDMGQLLTGTLAGFEFRLNGLGVRAEVGPLPACTADGALAGQVFANLIDNAIKYLDPARPGRITISGCARDGKAVYCVEDNGIGIAEKDRPKVFEIFGRLHAKDVPGEGLGLTIIRKLLWLMGGTIGLESTHGVGSKFYVTLPAAEAQEMPAAAPVAEAAGAR